MDRGGSSLAGSATKGIEPNLQELRKGRDASSSTMSSAGSTRSIRLIFTAKSGGPVRANCLKGADASSAA